MAQRLDNVFGIQWGDEAKAKIVDYLIYLISQSGSSYELGVRYGGGANAGHTVVIGDEKRVFHQVPSGGKKRVVEKGLLCLQLAGYRGGVKGGAAQIIRSAGKPEPLSNTLSQVRGESNNAGIPGKGMLYMWVERETLSTNH